jgi:hypothetical protein
VTTQNHKNRIKKKDWQIRRVVKMFMIWVLGSRVRGSEVQVQGSGFKGLGFRVRGSGLKFKGFGCQVSAQPLAKKTASLIEKETVA